MFPNMCPGAIGIRADFETCVRLAKESGFEGLDPDLSYVEQRGAESLKALYGEAELQVGGVGLPVRWQGMEEEYKTSLKGLSQVARLAVSVGCDRFYTWVPPGSDERPFQENFQHHVERLQPVAEILKDHGCRLGLEFIGPKTSRASKKYEFIHTLPEMLKLCDAIGTGNVGLLLDAWHWYTSEGTVDEIRSLRPEEVVYVHVNDAPEGVPVDEQIDNIRRLPGDTGVIDIAGFLQALNEIGYNGPVTPEPFLPELGEKPAQEAARIVGESMRKIWSIAGLG